MIGRDTAPASGAGQPGPPTQTPALHCRVANPPTLRLRRIRFRSGVSPVHPFAAGCGHFGVAIASRASSQRESQPKSMQVRASCREVALLFEVDRIPKTAAPEDEFIGATYGSPRGWAVRGGSPDTAAEVDAHAGVDPTMRLTVSLWPNGRCSGPIGKPEGCQRHARETDAELLQRGA